MTHVMARGWTPEAARAQYPTHDVIEIRARTDTALAGQRAAAGLRVVAVGDPRTADERLTWHLTQVELSRHGPVLLAVAISETSAPPAAPVDDEAAALIRHLMVGNSLGEAAALEHISRRTADRRVAGARRALGVATTAELVAAFRRFDASPSRERATLVGRADELAALREHLAGDDSVLVLGEAGVGKTALLRAALADEARTLRWVTGSEQERWRSLGALQTEFPEVPTGADVERAAEVVEAQVGPGILVVDDAHLLDAASLDVLQALASRVAVVAAGRAPLAGVEGADLTPLSDAFPAVLRLTPLSDADSVTLARRAAPALSEPDLTRVVTGSGGIPLLVELLSLDGPDQGPARIANAIRSLSDTGLRSIALLSFGEGSRAPDDGADELVAAGLAVRGADGRVRIRHGLVASAVVAVATEDVARAAHRTLAAESDDLAATAFHLATAGDGAGAAAAALRAAEQAGSPADQGRLLELAARMAEPGERGQLLLRAAEMFSRAGQPARALAALEGIDPGELTTAEEARRSLLTARSQWHLGQADDCIITARSGLTLVAGSGTPGEAALLGEIVSRECMALGPQPDHEDMVERALAIDGAARGQLLNAAGILSWVRTAGGVTEWTAGREAALREGDIDAFLRNSNNVITWHESNGDQAYALALANEMVERAGELGLGEWQAQFRAMAANLLFYRARFAEALELVEQVETTAIDTLTRVQTNVTKAACLIELGLLDAAQRALPAHPPEAGGQPDVNDAMLHASLHLAAGRPQMSKHIVDSVTSALGDDVEHSNIGAWSHLLAVRAWAEFDLGLEPTPAGRVSQTHLDSLLSREIDALGELTRDPKRAVALLDQLATEYEPRAAGYALRARFAHAEALRRAADPGVADHLLALEEEVDALGMAPLGARVRRSLRQCGVARSAPRGRDSSGVLTRREREVLTLVAGGQTYAEIGRRLGVGRPTVRRIAENGRVKLGAKDRLAAIASL
ncbi:MAG: hypothetical protein GC156_16420 [Actinomycetales bacterium]|nr:hypothetical protein [Actinomycetales bacterium]